VTQPGEDPFTKQRTDKRERVRKQAKQQLANAKAAAKAGTLPPTLRLAAALPEHGKGRPAKRKEMRDEVGRLGGHLFFLCEGFTLVLSSWLGLRFPGGVEGVEGPRALIAGSFSCPCAALTARLPAPLLALLSAPPPSPPPSTHPHK
jgi:hypothetical protein